jgi:putative effector of murein hydrolase
MALGPGTNIALAVPLHEQFASLAKELFSKAEALIPGLLRAMNLQCSLLTRRALEANHCLTDVGTEGIDATPIGFPNVGRSCVSCLA